VLLLGAACRPSVAGAPGASAWAAGPPPRPSVGCRPGAAAALVGAARTVTVGGEVRRYIVDAAAGSAERPLPVVLALHGFRGSAAGFRARDGLVPGATRGDYIAVHADGRDDVQLLGGVGRGWDLAPGDARDTPFVAALLDALERERCVDRRRIYATGFSNGGFFANLLACTLGDRLAAAAAVAGARPLDGCVPPGPIPMLFFHGLADPVVSPRLTAGAAAWWRRIDGCRGDAGAGSEAGCSAAVGCTAEVVVCIGPQGHAWPADATARILGFFRAQARPD
jgi:polyhydroxybutyrate depolymerase